MIFEGFAIHGLIFGGSFQPHQNRGTAATKNKLEEACKCLRNRLSHMIIDYAMLDILLTA